MDERLRPYLDAGYTVQSQGDAGTVLVAPRAVPRVLIALLVITPLICAPMAWLLSMPPVALLLAVVAVLGAFVSVAVYLLRPRKQVVIPPA